MTFYTLPFTIFINIIIIVVALLPALPSPFFDTASSHVARYPLSSFARPAHLPPPHQKGKATIRAISGPPTRTAVILKRTVQQQT
jgi:hypothetical protein